MASQFSAASGVSSSASPALQTGVVQSVEPDRLPLHSDQDSARAGRITEKVKICRFYRRGQCKYGKRGRDCKFQHPEACTKYIKYGAGSLQGCTLGKKCGKFHPQICFASGKGRECNRENCRYLHLKTSVSAKRHQTLNVDHSKTGFQRREQPEKAEFLIPEQRSYAAAVVGSQQPSDFLLVKRELESLKSQIAKCMEMVRTTPQNLYPPSPWQMNPWAATGATNPTQGVGFGPAALH